MKRRTFLQASAAASIPVMINGIPVQAVARQSFLDFVSPENDKILVLIQLTGGNDGLNMVLPLDQYSALSVHREKILINENLGLKLRDDLAIHPSMTGAKYLYDEGKLKLIQSVGYPNQNRSHFRSTDIWTTGSPANVNITDGWLGRYYLENHNSFPYGYPNPDNPDPLALTIGSQVSQTCQGPIANFSMAINNPATMNLLPISEFAENIPSSNYGNELRYIMTALQQTNDYTDVIKMANEKAGGTIPNTGNALLDRMNVVAQLIKGGLKTKVYVVSMGGFDTHANQCDPDDHEIGTHADLLASLAGAMEGFQKALEASGQAKRVLSMTFSEFGRRIKANDSTGTDHGSAAPLMLFGECIDGGILGDNPTIGASVTNDEGVAMQYDFRSIYATILRDWFGLSQSDVARLMYEDFQKLPLISGACTISDVEDAYRDYQLELQTTPNPATDYTTISFKTKDEYVRISLYDSIGSELKTIFAGKINEGNHQINLDISNLPVGNYVIRIAGKSAQKTKILSKI
ncbi:MAG: DUF1501 domain-containing protein [Saprospiraceae bacterium]|nr:DUF1501 domain-containing protein [Saprospiraceae bacterium]MBK7812570.1 DUF1501 domain-containing protein [Saprospiraceae bacterium]MBK9630761.1 DUF1501 domain-containing protein [Saprospiraceae bacterium]